jgi:hypothetical protein
LKKKFYATLLQKMQLIAIFATTFHILLKTIMKKITLLVLSVVLLGACKKDDHVHDDNELITTVRLKFTEEGTTNTQTFEIVDPDGPNGPSAISKSDRITLAPNKTYVVATEFWDVSKNPAVNVTEDIKNTAEEHLVAFTSLPNNLLAVTVTDKDSRNFPVGLASSVRTSGAATGQLRVVLRHQPNNIKNGTAGPGSTDAEVEFQVTIR